MQTGPDQTRPRPSPRRFWHLQCLAAQASRCMTPTCLWTWISHPLRRPTPCAVLRWLLCDMLLRITPRCVCHALPCLAMPRGAVLCRRATALLGLRCICAQQCRVCSRVCARVCLACISAVIRILGASTYMPAWRPLETVSPCLSVSRAYTDAGVCYLSRSRRTVARAVHRQTGLSSPFFCPHSV